MTSQINPYNINGQYPVAGQDNNSQGFRTNFTNTSTNLEYAAQEITALQTNAVLKAALAGVTLDNNMNGQLLYNALTQQITQAIFPYGVLVGSSQVISYTAGYLSTLTTDVTQTTTTISFSNLNVIPSGVLANWAVAITVTAGQSVIFTGTYTNAQGIQGWNTSSNTITFVDAGTYTFEFSTTNSGSTITVNEASRALQPFTSSYTLSANGNVSLAATTTLITVSSNLVANLSNGISTGQLLNIIYANASTGNSIITVSNAGWGGSGKATLTTSGSACTLQYINSKWYCIGNNGVAFS